MKSIIKKLFSTSTFILCLGFFIFLPVSAAISGDATKPEGIATFLLGNVMLFVGGVTMTFGIVQLSFAMRDEDASGKTKALLVALAGALLMIISMAVDEFTGMSGGSTTISIPNSNSDLNNDITAPIAAWIPSLGIIVMFWGAIQLALAMKNDNAGEKVKSLKILVAGAALWQIINFMNAILKA